MKELEGRVALVTGGSRNIGLAIATALAEAGASVMVTCRTSAAEGEAAAEGLRARGAQAACHVADVTDPGAVAAMVEATTRRFGGLDILVNNAAVRDVSSIDAIDYATWRRVTGIVLDGAFLCAKAALPALRASPAGAIVNIGGMSGHTGAAGRVHVVTAKLGLVGFTRALAHDLGPDGITVNCVVPGLIETQRGAASGAKSAHAHVGVLGHRGQPRDVAGVVRFLCGPQGRYVTGQEWHVNGGAYLG